MRWYVQPGRQLAYGPQEYDLDTPSLVSVTYRQDPKTAARSYRPADTDSLARTIAAALNVCGVTPDRPDTPLPLLLAAPMTGWAVDAATMTPEARTDLSQRLDALIERAARLRGYVDSVTECADIVSGTSAADAPGLSDRVHAVAVRNSNSLAAKVRKALGFAYPQHVVTF